MLTPQVLALVDGPSSAQMQGAKVNHRSRGHQLQFVLQPAQCQKIVLNGQLVLHVRSATMALLEGGKPKPYALLHCGQLLLKGPHIPGRKGWHGRRRVQ